MVHKRVHLRWILLLVFLCLFYGCGKAESDVRQAENRVSVTRDEQGARGEPHFILYYASVACSCTMARCQAALALCDSVQKADSSFVYQTVDVYTDTLAADSVAAWEVPVLMLLDSAGRERDRQDWDISVEDVHRLVQKGEIE
jgi:hypothetical protein